MSQKPNQHCQEEYYIDHENAKSIDNAPVCMQEYTGTRDGAVCPINLVSFT